MKNEYDKELDGKIMADELADFINNYSADTKGFVNGVLSQHRTLQQDIFRLFINTIKGWADAYDKGLYDLRNEQTCKLSKQIIECIKDDEYIPFI